MTDPVRAARWAALVAVVVYLPALGNGFAYDDLHIVADNLALRSFDGILQALAAPWWPGPEGPSFGLWRPLATLGLGLQWVFFGGAPWGFHLVNVLLHGAATYLVVRVGAAVLPIRVAGAAGFVFAVHPVHVEAVANVVGFAELAAAVWLLAALTVATAGPVGAERVPRVGIGRAAAVAGLYGAACLTKEHAIVLPALLLVLEAGRHRWTVGDLPAIVRRRAWFYALLTVVAAVVLAGRVEVLGRVAAPAPPLGAGLLAEIPRVHTLGEIWYQYLRLLTVPGWLSPDYAPGVVPVTTVWTTKGIVAVVAVLALAGAALLAGRRQGDRVPALPLGLSWFVVAVLPVSSVVFVAGVLVAERALYLPSVGAAWVLAALFVAVVDRGRRVGGLAVMVVGALWVGQTLATIPVWRDTASVFDHMVATVPESGRSQWVLGDALLDAGRDDEAVAAYARALAHLGDEVPFLTRVAGRLNAAGVDDVARIFALRAHDIDTTGAATRLLAVIAAGEGDWDATVRWARATREARPLDPVAGHLLSAALAEQGRWAEARAVREELLARDGGDAWQPWYWLVELRARTGDPVGARAAADSARARVVDPRSRALIDSLLAAVTAPFGPL